MAALRLLHRAARTGESGRPAPPTPKTAPFSRPPLTSLLCPLPGPPPPPCYLRPLSTTTPRDCYSEYPPPAPVPAGGCCRPHALCRVGTVSCSPQSTSTSRSRPWT